MWGRVRLVFSDSPQKGGHLHSPHGGHSPSQGARGSAEDSPLLLPLPGPRTWFFLGVEVGVAAGPEAEKDINFGPISMGVLVQTHSVLKVVWHCCYYMGTFLRVE